MWALDSGSGGAVVVPRCGVDVLQGRTPAFCGHTCNTVGRKVPPAEEFIEVGEAKGCCLTAYKVLVPQLYCCTVVLPLAGSAAQQGTTAGRQLLKKTQPKLTKTKATGQQKQGYRKTTKATLKTTSKATGQQEGNTGFDADGNQWWLAGYWNLSSSG